MLHFGQVIPLEDVERIFDLADSITRLPCGCRFISTGKTDKRYCFGLGMDKWGIMGKYPDAASSLEVLDKEEAKRLVREYDAEGLMHSVWTGVTPYVMGVCNCDHDCMAYRGYIEHGGPPDFFRGEDVGEVDWELCTGCKSCVAQCQFGAMNYSSVGAKVHINPRRLLRLRGVPGGLPDGGDHPGAPGGGAGGGRAVAQSLAREQGEGPYVAPGARGARAGRGTRARARLTRRLTLGVRRDGRGARRRPILQA